MATSPRGRTSAGVPGGGKHHADVCTAGRAVPPVIAAAGRLGGSGGNLALKRALLAGEGIIVTDTRVKDWKMHAWRPDVGNRRSDSGEPVRRTEPRLRAPPDIELLVLQLFGRVAEFLAPLTHLGAGLALGLVHLALGCQTVAARSRFPAPPSADPWSSRRPL